MTAITALGGAEARVDRHGGVTLAENSDLALSSVAARLGQEETCAENLTRLLGAAPPAPGKALLSDPLSAVWMGPDQWMIGADYQAHETLAQTCKDVLKSSASVTEQSDAWVCFDLSGAGIQMVMELLCNIDHRRMEPGDATRTSIHHLGCFVVCGEPDAFVRILGPRASAGSLHHALLTAMHSAL
nr:sarcosine oxidase subunit gamma [Sulfitobacter aestuariivivens]